MPDLSGALVAAGANAAPGAPSRDILARAIDSSIRYSAGAVERSPNQIGEYHSALHTLRAMLTAPPRAIDWAEISAAYGLDPESSTIDTFTKKLAGAEVMARAGADVVLITDDGRGVMTGADWDSHGDVDGLQVRAMMADRLRPLSTFLERTLTMASLNVVTALYADFARSGNSEHANGLSATVFGKRLKNASTGRAQYRDGKYYTLPTGTPGVDGFFAFLAAAAGVTGEPFGPNPHRTLFR